MASFEQALRKDLPHHWLETEAEVTDCTFARQSYEIDGAGMDTDLAHYVVTFTYRVNGTTYSGELSSPVQVEPGDTFLLRYNPADPNPLTNQTAQFCRQCHGGESNEMAGSTAGTVF